MQGSFSAHTNFEGDLVWMRQDTAWMDPNINVDENHLNCLGHLSSGSIIAGGDILKSQPNWHNEAWLLKISPTGCTAADNCVPLLSATPIPATNNVFPAWTIYPNPTSGRAVLLPDQQAAGRQADCPCSIYQADKCWKSPFPFRQTSRLTSIFSVFQSAFITIGFGWTAGKPARGKYWLGIKGPTGRNAAAM